MTNIIAHAEVKKTKKFVITGEELQETIDEADRGGEDEVNGGVPADHDFWSPLYCRKAVQCG